MSPSSFTDYTNTTVLIFGLGLHGGGAAAARFFARHGARVVVTDLRDEDELRPALHTLRDYPIRYSLGRHDEREFRYADIVVKNPAVARDHPLLALAQTVVTDISIFLDNARNPIIAVTGTKGKSTTAAAIAHACREIGKPVMLAGNIGQSVLDDMDALTPDHLVVLELSSFQLGDLQCVRSRDPAERQQRAQWPDVAICVNILCDHQDYYSSMDEYVGDKVRITTAQGGAQWLIVNGDASQLEYSARFIEQSDARVAMVNPDAAVYAGGRASIPSIERASITPITIDYERERVTIAHPTGRITLPISSPLIGRHSMTNIGMAVSALSLIDIPLPTERSLFHAWGGIDFRLQRIGTRYHITCINDSAATIPDATYSAVSQVAPPIYLIAGGSDKRLNLELFVKIRAMVAGIYLLAGDATDRIIALYAAGGYEYCGPYHAMDDAVLSAFSAMHAGGTLLISPGCASFGLFAHEFDRGKRFNAAVARYIM